MGTHPIFESDFDCLTDGKKKMIILFLFLAFFGCLNGAMTRHYSSKLLLISLDGFRWDYLHRDLELNHFKSFADSGVHAKWMTNQFQTKTFPNHWTMVTGLHEESHGIVANKFWDHS